MLFGLPFHTLQHSTLRVQKKTKNKKPRKSPVEKKLTGVYSIAVFLKIFIHILEMRRIRWFASTPQGVGYYYYYFGFLSHLITPLFSSLYSFLCLMKVKERGFYLVYLFLFISLYTIKSDKYSVYVI